jgi:hypothetical protein
MPAGRAQCVGRLSRACMSDLLHGLGTSEVAWISPLAWHHWHGSLPSHGHASCLRGEAIEDESHVPWPPLFGLPCALCDLPIVLADAPLWVDCESNVGAAPALGVLGEQEVAGEEVSHGCCRLLVRCCLQGTFRGCMARRWCCELAWDACREG